MDTGPAVTLLYYGVLLLCVTAWPYPSKRDLSRSLRPSRPPGSDLQVRCLHISFHCPMSGYAPPTTTSTLCRNSFSSTHCKLFSLHRSKIDSLTGARSYGGMIADRI
ncbi:hypothetical protein B296_00004963 [Ensete ventricosum]|uniref:Uncharacterized protein n=1 Tax=Ensete ventricosum TaxID=4639 RepID=A0A426YW03_ENSVE|nr:hypothetical protein B296_00004963 [Ensete ventricosum]